MAVDLVTQKIIIVYSQISILAFHDHRKIAEFSVSVLLGEIRIPFRVNGFQRDPGCGSKLIQKRLQDHARVRIVAQNIKRYIRIQLLQKRFGLLGQCVELVWGDVQRGVFARHDTDQNIHADQHDEESQSDRREFDSG